MAAPAAQAAPVSPAASAGLTLTQTRVGNVFLQGEPIRFGVTNGDIGGTWQARDFGGETVAQGVLPAQSQSLLVRLKAPGYYTLHVSVQGKTADTAFAILTPFDVSKVTDSSFGVMTHFAQGWDPDMTPLIARAGATQTRDEVYWNSIERTPGVYTFPAADDAYMARLRAAGIAACVPLDFENPLYDGGQTPYTQNGWDGYARYGQAVLRHYGTQVPAVEVWNEYNGSFCKGPATQDRAATYVRMLRAADTRLKQTTPGVFVLGGGTAGVPLPYWKKLLRAGGLRWMDGVSIHPYRYDSPPEGIEDDVARLSTLIQQYDGGRPKPIWVTEYGWFLKPRAAPGDLVVTEADQAKFLVRGDALLLSAGVQKSFWYLFRDDRNDAAAMGLVRDGSDPWGRYAPKPAYVAYAVMARQLSGAHFVRREPTWRGVYVLRFRRGPSETRVMWSLTPTELPVKARGPLMVVDMMGGGRRLIPQGGTAALDLGDAPLYVTGPVLGLPPEKPSERQGTLRADAQRDFSETQGQGGWFYGEFDGQTPGAMSNSAPFSLLPQYQATDWKEEWTGQAPWLEVTGDEMHPAVAAGHQVWAVRRWRSPFTGRARLVGDIHGGTQGDGVNAHVLVDGVSIYKRALGGGNPVAAHYDLSVPVHTGSTVDFAVDPGPALNVDYDATQFSTRIFRLPH